MLKPYTIYALGIDLHHMARATINGEYVWYYLTAAHAAECVAKGKAVIADIDDFVPENEHEQMKLWKFLQQFRNSGE